MEPRLPISNMEKIVCASLGAFVTSLVVTPLDVIKTRLQMQKAKVIVPKSFCCHNFSYCGGHVDFSFFPQIHEIISEMPKRPPILHGTWVSMENKYILITCIYIYRERENLMSVL